MPTERSRAPFGGIDADFAIGRIHDGGIECGRLCAEQITSERGGHLLNEVCGVDGECETDTCIRAATLAFLHGRGKSDQYLRAQFVERCLDRAGAYGFLAQARGECGGE
jgi:hypothetical protein